VAFLSLNFFGYTYSSDGCSRLVGDLKGRLDGCFGSSSVRRMKDLGRQDMTKKVFHSFDRDGDSRLSSDELMLFASCLPHDPFVGTRQDWDEYYSASAGSDHVDLERFRKLVDTRDHEGDPALSLYQTDEDLRRLLEMHSPDFRWYLLSSVFDIFDVDRDGILSKEELRVFAVSMAEEPFHGTAEHWEEFYAEAVGEDGPVDLELFQKLVDDRDVDAPLHHSEVELAQIVASHMAVTPRDLGLPMDTVRREQLISVLFDMFDMDRDGILSKEELMHFAQNLPHDAFEGSLEDWDHLYQGLVLEVGEPVDQERFAMLLDAEAFEDNPLDLTDDEIMHMLRPDHEEHGGEDDSVDSEVLDTR
jgi:Ca2+-binding EF-hand superfamily protein